eukprot:15445165-Alexandrium_andersonii.AAC.1
MDSIFDSMDHERGDCAVHLQCMQEVAVKAEAVASVRKAAASKQLKAVVGPPDPAAKKTAAGVGAFGSRALNMVRFSLKGAPAHRFFVAGRLDIYMVQLGQTPVAVVNLYGWAGGHEKAGPRSNTAAMVESALEFVDSLKGVPVIICADLNAEVEDIYNLDQRVRAGRLVDVCACSEWTGLEVPEPTCCAHGAKKATRRDFILIDAQLARHVISAKVVADSGYDVHAPICLTIRPPGHVPARNFLQPCEFRAPEGMARR